jgi:hypothetical protein
MGDGEERKERVKEFKVSQAGGIPQRDSRQ